jgi:hypothetical protein
VSFALLFIETALYAGQSAVLLWQRDVPMATVFFGYTVANIGLIIGARGG